MQRTKMKKMLLKARRISIFRRIIRNLLIVCVTLCLGGLAFYLCSGIIEFCELRWRTYISIIAWIIILTMVYLGTIFSVFEIFPEGKYSNYIKKMKQKQEKKKRRIQKRRVHR